MKLPLPLRVLAWTVLASYLLLIFGATRCDAQSTPFGKILFAPDRAWSWGLRQWPALSELDRTEERSAAMSGLCVEACGYALSKATPMSFRRGRQVVAAVYVARAVYGLASGETHRYRAHTKHVAAAMAAATLNLRWEIRW